VGWREEEEKESGRAGTTVVKYCYGGCKQRRHPARGCRASLPSPDAAARPPSPSASRCSSYGRNTVPSWQQSIVLLIPRTHHGPTQLQAPDPWEQQRRETKPKPALGAEIAQLLDILASAHSGPCVVRTLKRAVRVTRRPACGSNRPVGTTAPILALRGRNARCTTAPPQLGRVHAEHIHARNLSPTPRGQEALGWAELCLRAHQASRWGNRHLIAAKPEASPGSDEGPERGP
jgi:hypothetical protein